jgi:predicted transcriptional regulator
MIATRCIVDTQGSILNPMEIAFSDRELDVMCVLWLRGSATVAEVRDQLQDDLAYTTVLTVLQTLERKGHVRHEEQGKAYRYFSLVGRDVAARSALTKIVAKLFGGSPELLLMQLVADRQLSDEALIRMRELLDGRLEASRD